MKNTEIVNCYCFNPMCKSSIFESTKDIVVHETLTRVMSGPILCTTCKSELVSKPVLEVNMQIYNSLNANNSINTIGIDDDYLFILH